MVGQGEGKRPSRFVRYVAPGGAIQIDEKQAWPNVTVTRG